MVCTWIASSLVMFFRGGAALSIVPAEDALPNASQNLFAEMFKHKNDLIPFTSNAVPNENGGIWTISCPSGEMKLPRDGVILEHRKKKILWCPNAKVGTSTIFSTFAYLAGERSASNSEARSHGRQTTIHKLVRSGREKSLCGAIPFSFTVLRNPWDRVRSAYLDKINRVIFVPGFKNATFKKFLHAVSKTDPRSMNAHWTPVSTRCATTGPNRFEYSKVYKLEKHFGESLAEAFAHLGFSAARTREAMEKFGQQNVGREHHTVETRKKAYRDREMHHIIRDIYRDDIELGGYEFRS